MPEKFTFPTIQQAMTLQKAQNMEEIKITLRNWWNQNPNLKISQNVAWSFKVSQNQQVIRRYIHCNFCSAKICYIKLVSTLEDKQSSTFKLSKFYLHHDHRMIESVKQKGKMKTFPQNYPKLPEYNRLSTEKQRKQHRNKLRKKREEEYRYKKLELYYRLNMMIKEQDRSLVNVKELTARSLEVSVERFMNFLNSPARGNIEVSAIRKLLKRAGFEKYNVEMDNPSKIKNEKVKIQDIGHQNEIDSSEQRSEQKAKSKNENLIVEQSKDYFKKLMIFVNHNEISKKNLQQSRGFINISHLSSKVISKKFMANMKWDILLLHSHDENFIPNQLYGIIMIESSRFNIKQIKRSFEITFKLLNPLKKLHFQCCLHQENIYIMGALDLIIEENGQKVDQSSQFQPSCLSLSYFLSPKLSTEIINKCEFIPKIFRKKLIQKIYELDPKEIDGEFQKIITELQKASQIKEFKAKTEEYLTELKEFYENFHKIFLGKFRNPSFVSLIFTNYKNIQDTLDLSMDDLLSKQLCQYSEGNKYFLEFLILIFEVFKQPGGSFIYKRHQGETRQSTKVEEIYVNHLVFPEHQYFDQIKRFYNSKAYKGKYQKLKTPETIKENADFFQEFSAILYERLYKIRQIFMKVAPEVLTVLIREIQKSFTLQVQTKTIEQLKIDGMIRVKEINKPPNTIKILNLSKFWPTGKQNLSINLQEPQIDVIQLQKPNNAEKKKEDGKKLWQCDCNWSKFTLLPCSHEIRCCLTFFTSLQDQVDDFWLFDPRILELMEVDDNKSDVLTEDQDNDNSEKQNNSESD